MTIDELIELAAEAREDLGGDAQVRIAYQPGGWGLPGGHRHAPCDEPFLRHSRSVDTSREANAIRFGDTEYLLTVTADAVHLIHEAGPGEAGKVPSSPGTSAPDRGSPRRYAATTTPRSPGPAGERPRRACGSGSPWLASAGGKPKT